MVLPAADDDVYMVEAGRELDITCYSDVIASIEISRAENGTFIEISGKRELVLHQERFI